MKPLRKNVIKKAITLSLLLALMSASVAVILKLPSEPGGLTAVAAAHLSASGVEHSVTAVLLNFRGYDTWLELGVLLVAMLGVLCIQRQNDLLAFRPLAITSPVLEWFVRLVGPVMLLLAGYLLWLGKFAPGGAFQSGVVLGAAGVLLWLAGHRGVGVLSAWMWRSALLLGFVVFYMVAVALLLIGNHLFEYPQKQAGTLIVLMETAAAVSIGLVLASLFIGLQALPEDSQDLIVKE